MSTTFDTIIYNATIVTVNPTFDIYSKGMVGIRNGTIEKVADIPDGVDVPTGIETIDASGGIVMPGLVNTHTHMPMTLFRGLADDLPLDVWLNDYIFPAEGAWINPKNVRLGTALACAEMLLSGTTTVCDGYFFEEDVAEIVNQAGIRGILGQGVIDFPAPGVPDVGDNINSAVAFARKWSGLSPMIQPSIFCHSPYTCSRETIKAAKAAARSQGVLFQIHAAETAREQALIEDSGEMSPIQYLDHIGVLDEQTLLVHSVWVDDTDIAIIANSGAAVSHNPESNMKLASGIAPVQKFLSAGISVGIGTDGCASNNDLDMFQEMDTAAKLHKVHTLDPTVMDSTSILKMATIEAAAAIGLDRRIGSLEKGKQADLIILDIHQPHLVPMYNPVSQIVYSARGSDVRDVMVAGKMLVRNRVLTSLDQDDILNKVETLSRKIAAFSKIG
ncbi:MAG: amidohydrolase [Desulfobacterales bacterium]|nr:amidohydrolase [Desulfobacterales bacterium]MDX2511884.1 amidohydrolase [Desulfobacterales bacterium]